MTEKIDNFTDPACRCHDGVDRIKWVEMDGGVTFSRRGGKGVMLAGNYRHANALSSSLAGWLECEAVGVTNGHPDSVTSGDKLPVNFGLDKTCVFPTSNRVAVEADIGRAFDIVVEGADQKQYINMAASTLGVVVVTDIIDVDGDFVAVRIPTANRYGNL